MVDETIYATKGALNVICGGNVHELTEQDYDTVQLSVGTNTALAGYIVTRTGETSPAVDLAITTDLDPYGIILYPMYPDNIADYDIDTLITDGEWVKILKIGTGKKIKVWAYLGNLAGPVAVTVGQKCSLATNLAGGVQGWAYTDAAAATDTLHEQVGVILEADAGNATEQRVIKIELL
jgi:hypothetical protein